MLVYADGFDNLHPSHYLRIPGFYYRSYFPGSFSPWHFPFPLVGNTPLLSNDQISRGYCVHAGSYFRPCVFEKNKKIIVGFALGTNVSEYGDGGLPGGHRRWGRSWKYSSYIGSDHYVDICFLNNADTSGSDSCAFKCRLYLFGEFMFNARFITKSAISDGYPVIPLSDDIEYNGLDHFNYFEVMVDANGAENSQGCAELRLNGKTVYRQDGIVTLPFNDYASDAYNDLAYYSGVSFSTFACWGSNNVGGYGDNFSADTWLDDIYVCNGDGGVNDTFLGRVKVRPSDNFVASVTDFESVDDGVVIEDPSDLHEFLGVFLSDVPTHYLQAPADNSRDEFLHTFDIAAGAKILGVTHRFIGSMNPKANSIGSIFSGLNTGDGFVMDTKFSAPICSTSLSIADAIYDFNTTTSSLWNKSSLESTLFGFKYLEANEVEEVLTGVACSSLVNATGDVSYGTDEDDSTYITIQRDGYAIYKFDSCIPAYIDIVCSSSSTINFDINNILSDNVGFWLFTSPISTGSLFYQVTKLVSLVNNNGVITLRAAFNAMPPARRLKIVSRFYYYNPIPGYLRSVKLYVNKRS